MLFSVVKSCQRFGGAFSANMEAEGSSEILVSCYQTTRRQNLEGINLAKVMNVMHLESPNIVASRLLIQESVAFRRLVLVCCPFEVYVQIQYSWGRWRHYVLELVLSSKREGLCCDRGHGPCRWYVITADVYV